MTFCVHHREHKIFFIFNKISLLLKKLNQKSGNIRLNLGDNNSSSFHLAVNRRNVKVIDPNQVKGMPVGYYQELFVISRE